MAYVLLFSVFVIATCGLIYELIAGALASYLLGDSITQFSTVIGVYLFSMGVGSWLSRFVNRNLTGVFVQVEILVGLIGGCSAALLFLVFEHVASFRVVLYGMVFLTGTFVGLEIPLLMRILSGQLDLKDLVSKVFTFDYVGALIASLLFPLILVPHLGLVRSSFLFGILNVLVALWTLHMFRDKIGGARHLRAFGVASVIALVLGFAYSEKIMTFAEAGAYPDKIVYAKATPYQRIVLTRGEEDMRLYLNGNLQFSSKDEYRYHEALVHVGMAGLSQPKKVLILGGGDGLAVREVLKYPSVVDVKLVDLDPEMTRLFTNHDHLAELNARALRSEKVKVINADAFLWLRENREQFDFIIVDFPDPSNFSLGKLYTNTFYRLLKEALSEDGGLVVQSTSPYVARKSFWCVDTTLKSVGLQTMPYHAYVPSFGEWGFVYASHKPYREPGSFPSGLKFVGVETLSSLRNFPEDMGPVPTDVNKLNNQVLVRYFEDEWAHIHH